MEHEPRRLHRVDAGVIRRNLGASIGVGIVSFFAPYLGCLLAARYGLGWSWPEAQIAGIALSTVILIVGSSAASPEFRPREALIVGVLLAALAVGVFVIGLKLQLPIWPAFVS